MHPTSHDRQSILRRVVVFILLLSILESSLSPILVKAAELSTTTIANDIDDENPHDVCSLSKSRHLPKDSSDNLAIEDDYDYNGGRQHDIHRDHRGVERLRLQDIVGQKKKAHDFIRRNEPFVCRQECLRNPHQLLQQEGQLWWDDDKNLIQMEGNATIHVRAATATTTTPGNHFTVEDTPTTTTTFFPRYGEGAYKHINMTLKQYLDNYSHRGNDSEKNDPVLYAAQLDLQTLPGLRPYLPDWEFLDLFGTREQETIYIGRGTKTQLHYDSRENWVCVLSGTSKAFVLYDPITSAALLYIDAEQYGNTSPIENESEDIHQRYPMAQYALPVRVTLYAGDCLYLPIYWFHSVETGLGVRSISVNWWRRPDERKKEIIGRLLCGQSHRKASAKC